MRPRPNGEVGWIPHCMSIAILAQGLKDRFSSCIEALSKWMADGGGTAYFSDVFASVMEEMEAERHADAAQRWRCLRRKIFALRVFLQLWSWTRYEQWRYRRVEALSGGDTAAIWQPAPARVTCIAFPASEGSSESGGGTDSEECGSCDSARFKMSVYSISGSSTDGARYAMEDCW